MLDLVFGMEIARGWGPCGLVAVVRRSMMSMLMFSLDALAFGPRRWRPEPRKVKQQSNVRSIKLEMKFAQDCRVAEAAVSKESFNVARTGCDTSA